MLICHFTLRFCWIMPPPNLKPLNIPSKEFTFIFTSLHPLSENFPTITFDFENCWACNFTMNWFEKNNLSSIFTFFFLVNIVWTIADDDCRNTVDTPWHILLHKLTLLYYLLIMYRRIMLFVTFREEITVSFDKL